MKELFLSFPEKKYLKSYYECCVEAKAAKMKSNAFSDPEYFGSWGKTIIRQAKDYHRGLNLPAGYVPASTYWLIEGKEVVAFGSIRHRLTEDLLRFGGHIGYAVRPSKHNQGYGTENLRLLLIEAKKLGIDRALITCNEDNIGSARVIEKNGGVYQDTIGNFIEGEYIMTKRYWVAID